jgi:single-strand DNA-binding protein
MNTLNLIGRLTKEPELRYTPSGHANVSFTLAVRRKRKNTQTGEYESDFINCVGWRGLAETIANNVKKGEMLGVVGAWQTRNYEGQDGRKVYVNECLVEDLTFIGSKGGNSSNQGQSTRNNFSGNGGNVGSGNGNSNGYIRVDDDPFRNSGGGVPDIPEDDLPF